MPEDVLDLDRGIEGDIGVPGVEPAGDPERVAGPVEEVRVGKTDMAGPASHDLLDVVEHGAGVDDAGASPVDRGDRAVAAPVVAPRRGGDARRRDLPPAELQPGIPLERRQVPPQWPQREIGRPGRPQLDAN